MTRTVLLDSGPLGLVTAPPRVVDARACSRWLAGLIGAGARVVIPEITDYELRRELVRFVRQLRPEIVCCPDPTAVFFGDGYINHRDHRVTGWATIDAVLPAAGNPHYFPELRAEGYEVYQPAAIYLSGTFEPNLWVDISDTLERKIEALFRHASQLVETGDWFREFLRENAMTAGRAAGVTYAEAFRRVRFG